MPTKPVDRLLFAQGNLCFFCQKELPKNEATVEHLVASSKGGNNQDENLVACCKSLNTLFGNKSIKQKMEIVLKQKGHFKCPNGNTKAPLPSIQKPAPITKLTPTTNNLDKVLIDLKKRGASKPRRLKTLESTIKSLIKGSDEEAKAIIELLCSNKTVIVDGTKVTYSL